MVFDRTQPVLIIDDSIVTLQIIRRLLLQIGCRNVDTTEVATKGLQMLTKRSYGLIICDYFMSPINGWEVYRRLSRDPQTRHIPFLLTSTQEPELAITAEARTVLRTMAIKPFTTEVLEKRIALAYEAAAARMAATQPV